jgi:imidazole glycerol phosphate synthase glutamine amidotransferase subunit
MRIAVVRTGLANLASVLAALRRIGGDPMPTDDPQAVAEAPAAVLPGVGAFGPAAEALAAARLDDAIRARVAADRPLLCVCLGMQLLGTASEETPGARGLGIVDAQVQRFRTAPRVPQLGWNEVRADAGCRFLRTGHAYFANSFRFADAPAGWLAARTTHGEEFVAAMERGRTLACQFHPELSGAWGEELLRRWIEAATC